MPLHACYPCAVGTLKIPVHGGNRIAWMWIDSQQLQPTSMSCTFVLLKFDLQMYALVSGLIIEVVDFSVMRDLFFGGSCACLCARTS